jgi:hypothetical protein
MYGYFYLPEIQNRITASGFESSLFFKSGLLGNYFANILKPHEKLNKMKTLKDKNPIGSNLDRKVLSVFMQQQLETLALLEQAKSVSLSKTKTGISIAKWLKLKLGDTFRVVMYHNERHLAQANRVITEMESAEISILV